jgi:hypothetical protein
LRWCALVCIVDKVLFAMRSPSPHHLTSKMPWPSPHACPHASLHFYSYQCITHSRGAALRFGASLTWCCGGATVACAFIVNNKQRNKGVTRSALAECSTLLLPTAVVHEPVFFVRLLCLLLAPISLVVGRWVALSYASSHFPSCCVGTLARLAGDGRGCSLQGNFCSTLNKCVISCSKEVRHIVLSHHRPPTLVILAG